MFASPASKTSTDVDGSSERRAATVNPAVYQSIVNSLHYNVYQTVDLLRHLNG